MRRPIVFFVLFCSFTLVRFASAQVTPAAGYTPPDDTPSIRVGITLYPQYSVQTEPKVTDADGHSVERSAFDVTRAYINITGQISHLVAFRITPDITRESSLLAGANISQDSLVYRIKYAYAQFNLDDWVGKGSWTRIGIQQTPWVDFDEGIYRYRFQGTTFPEREGFLSSADTGASFHYNFARNYGDLHAGVYNGETYTRPEQNDQKGWMLRGTVRPVPTHTILRGWRVTGFVDHDMVAKNLERQREIFSTTFEHPYLNAGFDYLWTKDQPTPTAAEAEGKGWSVFLTPRSTIGWEALLRFDHFEPDKTINGRKRERQIFGVSYWFPHQGNVSTALLLDYDNATFSNFTPSQPTQRRYAVHALLNF